MVQLRFICAGFASEQSLNRFMELYCFFFLQLTNHCNFKNDHFKWGFIPFTKFKKKTNPYFEYFIIKKNLITIDSIDIVESFNPAAQYWGKILVDIKIVCTYFPWRAAGGWSIY